MRVGRVRAALEDAAARLLCLLLGFEPCQLGLHFFLGSETCIERLRGAHGRVKYASSCSGKLQQVKMSFWLRFVLRSRAGLM